MLNKCIIGKDQTNDELFCSILVITPSNSIAAFLENFFHLLILTRYFSPMKGTIFQPCWRLRTALHTTNVLNHRWYFLKYNYFFPSISIIIFSRFFLDSFSFTINLQYLFISFFHIFSLDNLSLYLLSLTFILNNSASLVQTSLWHDFTIFSSILVIFSISTLHWIFPSYRLSHQISHPYSKTTWPLHMLTTTLTLNSSTIINLNVKITSISWNLLFK